MSSRNPNAKRHPLLELADEMEKDSQRKKDAENAAIQSANQNWAQRHWILYGLITAALPIGLDNLGFLIKQAQKLWSLIKLSIF